MPKDENKITTPCPCCGRSTLFIGSGGHLTCGFLGCKHPGVEDQVNRLRTLGNEGFNLAVLVRYLVPSSHPAYSKLDRQVSLVEKAAAESNP